MYVFYFCTDHATRKAQQTSKNARRASSKFNCGRMWHRVGFCKAMIGSSQLALNV